MPPLGLDHWTSLFSLLFRFHCVVGYVFLNEHNHYRLSLAWKLHMPSVLSARKDSSTCVTKRSPLSCHYWKSFVIQRRQLARRFARCSKIFERCPVNKHTHTNEVFGARHPFYPICTPGLSLARPPARPCPTQHPPKYALGQRSNQAPNPKPAHPITKQSGFGQEFSPTQKMIFQLFFYAYCPNVTREKQFQFCRYSRWTARVQTNVSDKKVVVTNRPIKVLLITVVSISQASDTFSRPHTYDPGIC